MFGQAASTVSVKAVRASAAPSWDMLASRYSDDASDQSDEEHPDAEHYLLPSDVKVRHLSDAHSEEEESEDDDDVLESAVWAAVHSGTSPSVACTCRSSEQSSAHPHLRQ
jgi:hypothetical protein